MFHYYSINWNELPEWETMVALDAIFDALEHASHHRVIAERIKNRMEVVDAPLCAPGSKWECAVGIDFEASIGALRGMAVTVAGDLPHETPIRILLWKH